ncbi:hypothetical protein I5Q34_08740 [Streptomyces sp. AV19]|uniref:hypothetical protein n=1 Tax=Streptomyces sp. AV19 TaxID=2793068 RepID=UPI0018FED1C4|nr:hypothetical protein [Streptomyces sp. AV19]MBH1934376.1 hypothetical protein [Streptomyces sp. AV19]MDG4536224.1 hypothetical protein [Streptomyces sp. AV19]
MLNPTLPLQHVSGPSVYPTQDECGICGRFRSAINGTVGRIQWAQVTGATTELRAARKQEAEYRKGWADHLSRLPHKDR